MVYKSLDFWGCWAKRPIHVFEGRSGNRDLQEIFQYELLPIRVRGYGMIIAVEGSHIEYNNNLEFMQADFFCAPYPAHDQPVLDVSLRPYCRQRPNLAHSLETGTRKDRLFEIQLTVHEFRSKHSL